MVVHLTFLYSITLAVSGSQLHTGLFYSILQVFNWTEIWESQLSNHDLLNYSFVVFCLFVFYSGPQCYILRETICRLLHCYFKRMHLIDTDVWIFCIIIAIYLCQRTKILLKPFCIVKTFQDEYAHMSVMA